MAFFFFFFIFIFLLLSSLFHNVFSLHRYLSATHSFSARARSLETLDRSIDRSCSPSKAQRPERGPARPTLSIVGALVESVSFFFSNFTFQKIHHLPTQLKLFPSLIRHRGRGDDDDRDDYPRAGRRALLGEPFQDGRGLFGQGRR